MSKSKVIGFVLICAGVLAMMVVLQRCMAKPAEQQAAAAKADATLSDARAAAGQDAVGTVAATADREATIEQTTRENTDAIHKAPGADAAVDPAVASAGRASLCRRAAYRDSEQCKRLLGAGSR